MYDDSYAPNESHYFKLALDLDSHSRTVFLDRDL